VLNIINDGADDGVTYAAANSVMDDRLSDYLFVFLLTKMMTKVKIHPVRSSRRPSYEFGGH